MTDISIFTTSDIAQSVGIKEIPLPLNKHVSREAELLILNVISSAKFIKIQSKRPNLTVSDINDSLTVLRLPPLFGYSSHEQDPMITVHFNEMIDLKVNNDFQIPLDDDIDERIGLYPNQINFDCKWIIAQSKKVTEELSVANEEDESLALSNFHITNNDNSNDNSNDKIENNNEDESDNENGNKNSGEKYRETSEFSIFLPTEEQIKSKILRNYFKIFLEGFHHYGDTVYEKLLSKMVMESGVGPLLVYFLNFIEHLLKKLDKIDFSRIRRVVKLLKVIVLNDSFNVAICPDRLISYAFTVLLLPAKKKFYYHSTDNIFHREECCELFQHICNKLGPYNIHLPAQIAERLISILNDTKIDCYVAYSAVLCFRVLGPNIVKHIFFPNIEKILGNYHSEEYYLGPEKHLVMDAITNIIGNSLYKDTFLMFANKLAPLNASTLGLYQQLIGNIGFDMKKFCFDADSFLSI